jgi:hypothetical protein
MSNDISSDRFLLIASVRASGCVGIGHDLVCDDHRNPKLSNAFISIGEVYKLGADLIGKALQGTQELSEVILTRG